MASSDASTSIPGLIIATIGATRVSVHTDTTLFLPVGWVSYLLSSVSKINVKFVCLFVSISLTADGPQRARLPIPPINSIATSPSCLW